MSTEEKKTNLRFTGIKVLGFSQFDLEQDFDKDTYPLFEFKTGIHFRVIADKERVACLVIVTLLIKETEEKFADLKVETQFNVTPFKETVQMNKANSSGFDIPNILLYNIANVSVSTMRGILYEKLKGTFAQDEVFPLLDLAPSFLKEKGNQSKVK